MDPSSIALKDHSEIMKLPDADEKDSKVFPALSDSRVLLVFHQTCHSIHLTFECGFYLQPIVKEVEEFVDRQVQQAIPHTYFVNL